MDTQDYQDADVSDDNPPFISTRKGRLGYMAVKMAWIEGAGEYDIDVTGGGRFETEAEAIQEAKEWAAEEQLDYEPAPEKPAPQAGAAAPADTSWEEEPGTSLATTTAGGLPMAIIPSKLPAVIEYATELYNSGLAPDSMKNAGHVTVAILKGLELGVPPMQAVEGIAVINGRAAIWGDLGLALVYRSGLVEEHEEGWAGEGDEYHAWIMMKRRGMPAMTKTFSVAQAKKMNLWEGKNVPDNKRDRVPWVTDPDSMLMWRARWRLFRARFADILKGMPSAEEVRDHTREIEGEAKPVTPTGKPKADIAGALGASAPVNLTRAESAQGSPQTADQPADASIPTVQVETAETTPPADAGAMPKDIFEGAAIMELRTALASCSTVEKLGVIADEFQQTILLSSPGARDQMQEMLGLKERELKGEP